LNAEGTDLPKSLDVEAIMSTSGTAVRMSHQEWEYECPIPGGIVVGFDGSSEATAALTTGAGIARRRNIPLHAVGVIPQFPSYHLSPGVESSTASVNSLRTELKNAELQVAMKALDPLDAWTHETVIGRPVRAIVSAAERRGAELIVLGRHDHGVMDRVLGNETMLQIMRTTTVPALAVSTGISTPKVAVAAVDFSSASIAAVKAALKLLEARGTMHLTYVEPSAELLPEGFTLPYDERFPGDIVASFRRLVSDIGPRCAILVQPSVLTGRPVQCILDFAERVGADFIAAGSHGHTRFERIVLGSVSSSLARKARCGVLVAPPRAESAMSYSDGG
jgi:nucleotide-binding universal stress UspA family protein